MALQPAPTVRDSLVAAMETVETATPPVEVETPPVEVKPETPPETEAQKAERLRDEKGRFVEGKAEVKPKPEVKVEVKAESPKPKVPRPSSWKKELEPHWDTLAPEVQSYVTQREREYATGVSTYKTEADRAKDVMSAIAQFEPELQRHGVPVTKWISDLGNAHHTLALGSPQDKIMQVARIIQGYGVDAQALYQLLSGQQPQYQQQQVQAPPGITPQDIEKVVEEKLLNRQATSDYKAFSEAKDESGNPKYPYLEDVKGTMAGLLQADLAQDYTSAYEAALRHPRHANIWEVMQKQQTEQKEAERAKTAQATATRARSQAVSVKSSTPTIQPAAEGKKSRLDTIADAFEQHISSSRV